MLQLQHSALYVPGAAAPTPEITTVTPNTGDIAGGTPVTLAGVGFTGSTGVTFGGTPGTAFSVDSDIQISVTTPAHAAGAVDVVTQTTNITKVSGFTFTEGSDPEDAPGVAVDEPTAVAGIMGIA